MKKILFITLIAISYTISKGQDITIPKTVLNYEQGLIFPAQNFDVKLYILNRVDSLTYKVIYYPIGVNRPKVDSAKYNLEEGFFLLNTMETYGRPENNENFVRKRIKYKVQVTGNSIDTSFNYQSEVLIHKPIMNFDCPDTLQVNANEEVTIRANYPINIDYFKEKNTKLSFNKSTSSGSSIVTSDMYQITFLANGEQEYLELISNCGGNIAGKVIIHVNESNSKRKKKKKKR